MVGEALWGDVAPSSRLNISAVNVPNTSFVLFMQGAIYQSEYDMIFYSDTSSSDMVRWIFGHCGFIVTFCRNIIFSTTCNTIEHDLLSDSKAAAAAASYPRQYPFHFQNHHNIHLHYYRTDLILYPRRTSANCGYNIKGCVAISLLLDLLLLSSTSSSTTSACHDSGDFSIRCQGHRLR